MRLYVSLVNNKYTPLRINEKFIDIQNLES